jgi:5-methyltetrahydropteroyltriglutamate--homocysteine methyltransferase
MPGDYKAEQVGSFLRPPEVLQAHSEFEAGALSVERLREIEDRAILALLQMEREVGIEVLSDGEYRRAAWAGDFPDAVDGYVDGTSPITLTWRQDTDGGATPSPSGPPTINTLGRVIGEKLRRKHRMTEHEVGFLKEHTGGHPFKVTMPAPSYIVARGYKPGVTDQAYPSRSAVLADVVAIMRDEVRALIAEGVPYIQIDNPHYPDYIPEERRAQWKSIGIDPDVAIGEDIAADNELIDAMDRERVTVAMHLCRGNGGAAGWHTEGSYERIAEQVFGRLNVDRFLLEYDSKRAGEFEPLRFVPSEKTVVLGLVTTKSGELESQDTLLHRIDEASRYVPMERLAVSPQCGFASVMAGNLLTADQQRRKLELVVSTAHRVWG